MALVKCAECGREISDRAESCPQCGLPLTSRSAHAPVAPPQVHIVQERKLGGCAMLIVGSFLLLILLMAIGQCSRGTRPSARHAESTSRYTPPTSAADPSRWHVVGKQGHGVRFIVMEAESADDKNAYMDAAIAECPKDWCQAMFWTDRTSAASAIPMTDAQAHAQVALYIRNASNGLSRWRWHSDRFPGTSDSECFR